MADIPQFTRLSIGPQIGVIPIAQGDQEFNIRLSCVQTRYGESAVLRFYDKKPLLFKKCGFYPKMQLTWQEMMYTTGGLLLLAGPHGSGKTTTAYATLNRLNDVESKILSIEEIRGYDLPGVQQMYLSNMSVVSYSDAVGAALRACPDVLFLGGIDTAERARCALEVAQSGPLVLATLSANDAQTAITHFTGWGVPTKGIRGILAQTLIRRICPDCSEEYLASDEDHAVLHRLAPYFDLSDEITLKRGRGCEKCRNTGYLGRIGVYELLGPNEGGLYSQPLFDRNADAAQKILDGVLTIDEVRRRLLSPNAGR